MHALNLKHKNLDALKPSREQNPGGSIGAVGSKADPLAIISLDSVTAYTPKTEHTHGARYRDGGTKFITVPQATNLMKHCGLRDRLTEAWWRISRSTGPTRTLVTIPTGNSWPSSERGWTSGRVDVASRLPASGRVSACQAGNPR